jgi:YaiO family outer membrane protein
MRGSAARERLVILLLLVAPGPLLAQDGEDGRVLPWSATLYYDVTQIASPPDEAYWHTVTAGVARRMDAGSVALQGLVTQRFDVSDAGAVVDVYRDLWRGAYGNVRVGMAPGAEVLARYDAGAELFQTVGNVELAASFRHQSFEVAEVNTMGAAAAYYVGRWYLRPRTLVAHVHEAWSPFVAFTARRYLGEGTDDRFDVAAGFGEEVLEIAAPAFGEGPLDVITSGSRFVSLGGQRYLARRLGLSAAGWYSEYEEIPNRWGVSVGVLTRW